MVEPDAELNELSRKVIGAAIEVHRHLGPGYLESVYEDALAAEFRLRRVEFERQVSTRVVYKGSVVGQGSIDFLVARRLVVELKTVSGIMPIHKAQVISYLKATSLLLGLVLNFNVAVMTAGVRRIVRSS